MANDTLVIILIGSVSPKSSGRSDTPGIWPMFTSAWFTVPLTHSHLHLEITVLGEEDPLK